MVAGSSEHSTVSLQPFRSLDDGNETPDEMTKSDMKECQ
jgi:hypothetical protein